MQFLIKCFCIEYCQKSKKYAKKDQISSLNNFASGLLPVYTTLSLGLGKKCRRALNWFFRVDWWCVFILCQTEHSWTPGYWTNPLPLMKFPIHCEASTNKCAIWRQGYQMWQSSSDSHSHATVTGQFLGLFEAEVEK